MRGLCFLIVTFFLILIPVGNIFANYSSISLSPSGGQIKDQYLSVDVNVNSGSDEFIGIDANIAYTGPLSFVEGTSSKCGSFQATNNAGVVNIECFYFEGGSYNGEVATLRFKITGSGNSVFSITSTDPETDTKTGATYTLSLSSETNDSDNAELPATGIFDDSRVEIAFGFFLLLLATIISKVGLKGEVDRRRDNFEKKF